MHLETALEQNDRAQRVLGAVTPELGRNLLWAEQRRAESGVVACETTRQAIEKALAELRLALPRKE